jgi:hypothetical protein
MPGTLAQDAIAPNLAAGATLNSAGTTNGDIWESTFPHNVRFELDTATVTGTTPTLLVEIRGADNAAFNSGVVSFGAFPVTSGTAASQSDIVRYFDTYVDKRYVRAVVTVGGTNPVYTGTTVTPRQPHDRRRRADTA